MQRQERESALFDCLYQWLDHSPHIVLGGHFNKLPGVALASLQILAVAPMEGIYDPEALNDFSQHTVYDPINQHFGLTESFVRRTTDFFGGLNLGYIYHNEVVARQELTARGYVLNWLQQTARRRSTVNTPFNPFTDPKELIERTIIECFPDPNVARLVVRFKTGFLDRTAHSTDLDSLEYVITAEQIGVLKKNRDLKGSTR